MENGLIDSSNHFLIGIIVLALALSSMVGCSMIRWLKSNKYRESESSIENPIPELNTVAVLPFKNESGLQPNPKLSKQLTSRMNFLVNDLNVVWPRTVQKRLGLTSGKTDKRMYPENIPEAKKWARELDVDAVLIGKINEYDPYHPPVLGVSIILISRKQTVGSFDLNRWMQAAKPPITTHKKDLQNIFGALSVTYDSNRDDVRDDVKSYAMAHVQKDSGFENERRYLMMDKFSEFVAVDLTHRLFGEDGPLASFQKKRRRILRQQKKSQPSRRGSDKGS